MDAISALDIACGILAIVEFSAELISTSNQSQGESSLDTEKDFVLQRLRTLRLTLSAVNVSSEQQFSDGASQLSSDALALQKLSSSCIEDSGKLLENVENILRDFPGRGRSQLWKDTKAWTRSMIGGRLREEKIERLSRAVTCHISSIIRCATWLYEFNNLGDTDTQR